MINTTVCELCHKEKPVLDIKTRYVAVKGGFFEVCSKCCDKVVTYSPEEWDGPDGTVTIC